MSLTKIRKNQVNGLIDELNKIKEQIQYYKEPVAKLNDLPIENNNEGDVRVCLEDKNIYVWSESSWHINTVKGSFSRTIFLTINKNNQKIIETGIRFDDKGNNITNSDVINLYLNGILIDNTNYNVENVDGQMIINWICDNYDLLINDLISVQFYDITGGLKLNLGGGNNDNTGPSGPIDTLIVSNAILPDKTKSIDIGSEQLRFRSIYVDEAHLDANTLYIDGVPVIGSNSDTILVKADPDQGISIKTTGSGSTKLLSENNVEMSTNGMNADVNLKASGVDSKVNISGTSQVNITAPTVNLNGEVFTNNVTIKGSLNVQGKTTTVNSENLSVRDNIIELNKGETGSGITAGQSGIKIDRGDNSPVLLVFDESDDSFKIGEQNNLKTIADYDYVEKKIQDIQNTNCNVTVGKIQW